MPIHYLQGGIEPCGRLANHRYEVQKTVIEVTLPSGLCVIALSMLRLSFLKPAVLAFALLLAPGASAQPSQEMLEAWTEKAADLHQRLSDLQGETVPDILRLELSRFGRVSGRLANSGTDEQPLPEDLACIFRGMSDETDVQLERLSMATSPDEIADAKKRLLHMLEDATIIGESAEFALQDPQLQMIDLKPVTTSGRCALPDPSS